MPIAACVWLLCTGCSLKSGSSNGEDAEDASSPDGSVSPSLQTDSASTAVVTDSAVEGSVSAQCKPTSKSETVCGDTVDQDCDGFIDCLDPDCDDQSCGAGNLACHAGGCLAPCTGDGCLSELPRIENVVARVRGDTLLVDFSAVQGARDYRIYPYPAAGTVLKGKDGEQAINNAIYRCSGDRPRPRRDRDGINMRSISLAGNIHGYTRSEADALLGYVYLTPGAGREPVYRVGNPNRNASYTWPSYVAPPGIDYTGGDYVLGTAARDALLQKGHRDDGIAFYAPEQNSATRAVLRYEDASNEAILFYTSSAEAKARPGGSERFKIFDSAREGTVPLYRIFYAFGADHDVLAAGDANRARVLDQGNIPVTTLAWPGMTGSTTFVIEALDQGCPFPGGFIGASAAPPKMATASVPTAPTITLESARNPSTGEIFVNGQHAPTNRPRPIARSYVTSKPAPQPDMDWFMAFDKPLSPFTTMYEDGNNFHISHNDKLSMEGDADRTVGSVLGQLFVGSSSSFSLSARGAGARIESEKYLHVTMSVDIASTNRRYPQIFITDAPLDPPAFSPPNPLLITRLGPRTFEMLPPGDYHSILMQVFGPSPELQVQFCDRRGWGVSDQCPRANLYGFHAGADAADWTAPWLPVPVMGEYVGLDRPVKFDVYASTKRVYVFVEDRPAGCAVLPAGRMPEGAVNVMFGAAGYHIEIDEFIEREPAMHEFWRRQSLFHIERHMDDLGVDSAVGLPVAWDESVLPCGDRFYL